MITLTIIEDEFHSRALLQEMIEQFFPNVHLLGTAASVVEGRELIRTKKPDLVLLDIYLSGGTGFQVLDAFHPMDFKVIFVTGYEKYALKAIKYAALDYLLKPVILEELQLAIDKVKGIPPTPKAHINFLKTQLEQASTFEQLVLTNYKTHQIVNVA
ncbi:MAG: response regulator, partial [Bacteroidota bacterium]